MARTISAKARDRKIGMTVDEVAAFMLDLSASAFGGETVVRATVGLNARVLTLTTTEVDRG